MTFEIRNHRIVGATFIRSPNQSVVIKPEGAVMHWTAGATAASAIGSFLDPNSDSSAHFVIHEDGDVTQMVDLNRSAWHAGPSILNGRPNCNRWTHGFEIVNPGFYTFKGEEVWNWNGSRRISDNELAMWPPEHRQKLPRIGGGTYGFPAFKPAQIETALALLAATSTHYGYTQLAGHDEIDKRGWKVDPGPLFPWPRFDAVVTGKNKPHGPPDDAPRGNVPPTDSRNQDFTGRRTVVDATSLNVRKGPGTNWPVVGKIARGTPVEVLRDEGDWCRIAFGGGKIGWVADAFLRGV